MTDRILSGQAFLYRGGTPNTVVEAVMTDKVRGDSLRLALDKTIKRYPYLSGKFVEKNGNFYLQENTNGLNVVKTKKPRALGGVTTNYHLIDITYFNKSIRISFHHALCDGRGIKPFVETLVYYYCSLRFHKRYDSGSVRLFDSPLLDGETFDPYENGKYAVTEFTPPNIIRDGYALPENETRTDNCFRVDIDIPKSKFIEAMKARNATPAILLSLLLSAAVKKLHPTADKPIVASLATDCRFALGCGNTHRNCVGSVYLPYTAEIEKMSFDRAAAEYRKIMAEQKDINFVRSVVNSQMEMFANLDKIKSPKERQNKISFIGDMTIDTFVISYLGRMDFGGAGEKVNFVNLFNSGTRGMRVNMTATDNYFTVNVLADFPCGHIAIAFANELTGIGLTYRMSDCRQFDTGKDKTHITAPRQSERYSKKLK